MTRATSFTVWVIAENGEVLRVFETRRKELTQEWAFDKKSLENYAYKLQIIPQEISPEWIKHEDLPSHRGLSEAQKNYNLNWGIEL